MKITYPTQALKSKIDDIKRIEKHLQAYIQTAKNGVESYQITKEARDGSLIQQHFGLIEQADKTVLVQNLSLLSDCLDDYKIGEVVHSRKLKLVPNAIEDDGIWAERGTPGQSIPDLKHKLNTGFSINIEIGLDFIGSDYGEMVNTVIHEMTHIIINSDDVVDETLCSFPDGTTDTHECYGLENVEKLAKFNTRKALKNADSYSFYICSRARRQYPDHGL